LRSGHVDARFLILVAAYLGVKRVDTVAVNERAMLIRTFSRPSTKTPPLSVEFLDAGNLCTTTMDGIEIVQETYVGRAFRRRWELRRAALVTGVEEIELRNGKVI
jgi:hypothetical protein